MNDCGPAGCGLGGMKMVLWRAARDSPLGSRLQALCSSTQKAKDLLPLLGGEIRKRSPGCWHCGLGLGV